MSTRAQVVAEEKTAHQVARALADPQRYRIMKLLAQSEATTQCAVLFEAVKLAPATLSHHMRELRDAGLVEEHRTGRTVQYRIRSEVVETFLRVLRRDLRLGTEQTAKTICDLPLGDPSIR